MLMWIATATDAVRSKLPLPSGLMSSAAVSVSDALATPPRTSTCAFPISIALMSNVEPVVSICTAKMIDALPDATATSMVSPMPSPAWMMTPSPFWLAADDAAVASERKERPCHGCVWAADADLERELLLQEVDRRAEIHADVLLGELWLKDASYSLLIPRPSTTARVKIIDRRPPPRDAHGLKRSSAKLHASDNRASRMNEQ